MTSIPTFDTIKLEVADNVATITLNRPERLNSMPPAMADDIRLALDHLPGLGARALLITGEGRGFCSGADLGGDRSSAVGGGANSRKALRNHYNPMLLALANLDIPVVVAVNGPAAGVGCSFGLSGDFTIAGKSAYFLQAFVNIGLVPDGGSSWLLPRLIGLPRATQMMMLGEKIGAEQAADWGLIYKCVEDDALMAEARALATRLASGPTVSLGTMRKILRDGLSQSYADTLDAEAKGQFIAGNSADAVEGIMAFVEKRKTAFKGK
ncbi:enoyl-CoA hydratase-related protein [Sphingopyxis witflariensis]|uniref:2-(1,2-epoxy-1,2-dihydrophenyl)acetyl-CoA isomerase n=1 Tax=Sphingopyxis witflariensis TaxID=173675 RepID=A0A246K549_9SPHN|nr:enoyl-CoA hydratase-related protein [Sphingopyxis witflariensis]OWR01139.1 2-(1,2-epoxy-1,2-dihydrophenyl)acetyl-CoA isomerase [Sphingopyxis witflariensis]